MKHVTLFLFFLFFFCCVNCSGNKNIPPQGEEVEVVEHLTLHGIA
jgi:hypothetical protein